MFNEKSFPDCHPRVYGLRHFFFLEYITVRKKTFQRFMVLQRDPMSGSPGYDYMKPVAAQRYYGTIVPY